MRHAGSYYLIFVGLLFCLVGGVFAWLMWRSFERASGQRHWTEVPCTILEAAVEDRRIGTNVKPDYRFAVLYGYEVGGVAQTSDRYTLRGSPWSGASDRAEELVERYPVGSSQTCFVDPEDPGSAVLKLDSKGPGYSLWFPLLFVVGGLGIIVGALQGLRRSQPGRAGPGVARDAGDGSRGEA